MIASSHASNHAQMMNSIVVHMENHNNDMIQRLRALHSGNDERYDFPSCRNLYF